MKFRSLSKTGSGRRPVAPGAGYALVMLLVGIMLTPSIGASADDSEAQRLFHIERNKNANIVVYDALVLPDGTLRKKDPIEVYWLKLAEDGERKGLKRIERRMAYGFKVQEQESKQLLLEMKADIDRDILVAAIDDTFGALIDIDGHRSILSRIYIFAEESGMMPKVKYLELFGVDLETGDERYEKYLP
jgi:hypothetical protein